MPVILSSSSDIIKGKTTMNKTILTVGLLGIATAMSGCAGPHGLMGGPHTSADRQHEMHMSADHPSDQMGDMHHMGMHGDGMHHDGYDMAADRSAAEAVLRDYSDAINEESIEGMEALVTADERFSVIEGRGIDVGWTNYRDHHLGPEFASERIDFHSYAYDDIEVRVGHMFAYATFTYAFEATLDGEPYNKDGRGTAVLQRTPDGWRIRHIQTS